MCPLFSWAYHLIQTAPLVIYFELRACEMSYIYIRPDGVGVAILLCVRVYPSMVWRRVDGVKLLICDR